MRIAVLMALCLLLLGLLNVRADALSEANSEPPVVGPGRLAGGGTVAVRALANQVNDPTAPLTLVQFRNVVAPSISGYSGAGNVLQVEPVFPIFPTRLLPFEQLVKMTLPFPTTPNPGSETGFGDLQFFDLVSIKQSWGRWGFGPAFVFPTATSTSLGQGKWQAGPALGAIYAGFTGLQLGGVLQNATSFAGDSSRPSVNALTINPTLTYNLPHGWFVGYSDFEWTFDWANGGAATIPVGMQVGKVFSIGKLPVSLSIESAYNVVRPSGAAVPEWLFCLELTVIFKTYRQAR